METVETFTGDNLKAGVGDQDWLRFFALMSSVIAEREGTTVVPDTPTNRRELVSEIRQHDQTLGISRRLAVFQNLTLQLRDSRSIRNHWVGLELDPLANQVAGRIFNPDDWESANDWYSDRELENRDSPHIVVVLVSSSSLSDLRRAYPNFFADIGRSGGSFRRPSGRYGVRPGELFYPPGPRSLTAFLGLAHDPFEPLRRALSIFTDFHPGRHIESSVFSILSPVS